MTTPPAKKPWKPNLEQTKKALEDTLRARGFTLVGNINGEVFLVSGTESVELDTSPIRTN